MHNYHDVQNAFPPGFNNKLGWSWGAAILPFIEQTNVFEALDKTSNRTDFDDAAILAAARTVISGFRCPSDSAPDLNDKAAPLYGPGSGRTKTQDLALSNYIGSMGNDGGATATNTKGNGVLWPGSNVKLRDILDGTSNTIMVGERDYFFHRGSNWAASTDSSGGSTNRHYTLSSTDTTYGLINGTNSNCFGSLHPGGTMFVFCDASVHFIPETIDATNDTGADMSTYQRLGNSQDGLAIGAY
ncbi:hypothetical protein DSM3645_03903 [Blastopirellula marina DSM 3645]|uniref:DUF1559 domain-containing protein n=2 Tax=Blastopirellula marina TaxID=124 RepID=A3ZV69_9BACT|nr:hypothetical protein DSM3645_03903 [Blastopirellula marina DSM 3645]